jgi:reverse gyrase
MREVRSTTSDGFCSFFEKATTSLPYDYQRRLATEVCADGPKSLAINVPTGAGKTAAAVLEPLWHCSGHRDAEHRNHFR